RGVGVDRPGEAEVLVLDGTQALLGEAVDAALVVLEDVVLEAEALDLRPDAERDEAVNGALVDDAEGRVTHVELLAVVGEAAGLPLVDVLHPELPLESREEGPGELLELAVRAVRLAGRGRRRRRGVGALDDGGRGRGEDRRLERLGGGHLDGHGGTGRVHDAGDLAGAGGVGDRRAERGGRLGGGRGRGPGECHLGLAAARLDGGTRGGRGERRGAGRRGHRGRRGRRGALDRRQ